MAHNTVEKSGSWYSYGEIRLGQGRENSRKFLKDNPDLAMEIDGKIRVALGLTGGPNAKTSDEQGASAASEQGTAPAAPKTGNPASRDARPQRRRPAPQGAPPRP